jgi:hypothetical protein
LYRLDKTRYEDYAWLTMHELEARLEPEYFSAIRPTLSK